LSSSQKFWRALLRAVAREDLVEDPRFRTYQDRTVPENYKLLVDILEQEFARHSYAEWERRLSDADVPFAQALTMRQLAEHPQTQWLQMFDRSENSKVLLRLPWKLDGARPRRPGHVPAIGEHTRQVLAEVLSEGEIDELAAGNTIFAPAAVI
jgi:formyl-CoA transferase